MAAGAGQLGGFGLSDAVQMLGESLLFVSLALSGWQQLFCGSGACWRGCCLASSALKALPLCGCSAGVSGAGGSGCSSGTDGSNLATALQHAGRICTLWLLGRPGGLGCRGGKRKPGWRPLLPSAGTTSTSLLPSRPGRSLCRCPYDSTARLS